MKCDNIPNGTFQGAVASIMVADEIIMFFPNKTNVALSFNWNRESGEFQDLHGQGIAIVRDNEVIEDKKISTIKVKPNKRNKLFPRVDATDFFFVDGQYDGDGNSINNKKIGVKYF